ncbi:MAG: sigma-54-dependent Fis family transcriptional regulator [Candidatus Eisenbacteria sp.]|nr:sigma-54-dependent Fis family transcriptional regulator [Candidatus Eisenbacteria bacterium]
MNVEASPRCESTHILVVDDEESIRISLSEALADKQMRTRVSTALGGEECFQIMGSGDVDFVLLDQRLSATQENGLDVLRRIKEEYPGTVVVMMTAYGKFESAVEATKLGCFQYIAKPLDLHQLKLLIRNALEKMALTREVRALRAQQRKEFAIGTVFGSSPRVRQLLENIKKVARSRTSTVLIRGETGSGKDLVARRIHFYSDVASGPFVDINCSAVPDHLLESELFGHEKGAFTDAKSQKEGLFETANGGTVFLDEVSEMPPKLQAKLLKVLEAKTFRRVGGTQPIRVDIRILAATNRDLFREVEAGHFREDLYYRLSVIPIFVPPLRDRREDIPLLVKTFLEQFDREIGRNVRGVTDRAMALLVAYNWPGNVRELKNLMERLVLMGSGERIDENELPEQIRLNLSGPRAAGGRGGLFQPGRVPTLEEVERVSIEHALAETAWNKTKAADLLGISRQTLRTKIKQYTIEEIAVVV